MREINLVKIMYETAWMHSGDRFRCLNITDGVNNPIFLKVPGLNFYNFDYPVTTPFVMTNDFLAGFSMQYD